MCKEDRAQTITREMEGDTKKKTFANAKQLRAAQETEATRERTRDNIENAKQNELESNKNMYGWNRGCPSNGNVLFLLLTETRPQPRFVCSFAQSCADPFFLSKQILRLQLHHCVSDDRPQPKEADTTSLPLCGKTTRSPR